MWWRAGRVLRTPGLDLGILAGVTRAALIELAGALGLEVAEGAFDAAELHAADEAFLSSTVREVMPIVRVDGSQLGDGRPGPAAAALRARLLELAAGA